MKKYAKKEVYAILALLFVAIAPLLLQKGETVSADDSDVSLVVMSPHNETIQREFGEAFSAYWEEKTGKKVYLDWRTPGGTAEVRLVLENDFKIAEEQGKKGIGVDVLFGGGDYLFKKMAAKGRLVKLDVFEQHKEWFAASGAKNGIKETFTGERCYGKNKQWVGVCLSEFGICYNTDGIKRLGITAPTTWDDLGDPKYFGHIALADPTKSGSVAKAFEMLIQQKIHDELAVTRIRPGESRQRMRERAISTGWAKGLQLIQRISANARYFTDSASKIPHDVAQGDAVAGMCVDFYGRTYNEKHKKADGSSRLQWISPTGGTSTGVDPVAVVKGAEHPKIAQGFVEFLLTEKGQMLWNARPGTKNGPRHKSLRRLPIRPDLYTPKHVADYVDADQQPYSRPKAFVYKPEITGELFEAMREEIRVMCIETHDSMTDAWGSLIENSKDGVLPKRALERFNDVKLFSYKKTFELKRMLDKKRVIDAEQMKRVLWVKDKLIIRAAIFRRSYADAKKLAEKETKQEATK